MKRDGGGSLSTILNLLPTGLALPKRLREGAAGTAYGEFPRSGLSIAGKVVIKSYGFRVADKQIFSGQY